eukprot:g10852.t1
MPILITAEFAQDLRAQQEIHVSVAGKTLRGYFCRAQRASSALVLIFPNYCGLKTWDREVGAWVARLGYHALVCDYYEEKEFPYALREAIEMPLQSPERKKHFELGMRVMNECLLGKAMSFLRPMVSAWLAKGVELVVSSNMMVPSAPASTSGRPQQDEEQQRVVVSTLGYCLGGVAGLELWRSGAQHLHAVVSVHGVLKTRAFDPQVAATAEKITTPKPGAEHAPKAGVKILLEHGEADHLVPPDMVDAFLAECKTYGAEVTLHTHADTPHGFALPLGVGNAAFPEADKKSCKAILEFWQKEVFRNCGAPPAEVTKTPGGVSLAG